MLNIQTSHVYLLFQLVKITLMELSALTNVAIAQITNHVIQLTVPATTVVHRAGSLKTKTVL